jgi:hypothetical protein
MGINKYLFEAIFFDENEMKFPLFFFFFHFLSRNLAKFSQNIGNLVEFTFKTQLFPEISQLFCFKK